MADSSTELAKRVATLESQVADLMHARNPKDWRRTIGMFEGSELIAEIDRVVAEEREANRAAARTGTDQ